MKRRATLRQVVRLPLSFGRNMAALTADVSRGGFQAELQQPLPVGAPVDGFFLMGDDEVPFQGRVQWAVLGHPQLMFSSRVGIEFQEVPFALEQLFRNLEKRKKRLKRPAAQP